MYFKKIFRVNFGGWGKFYREFEEKRESFFF